MTASAASEVAPGRHLDDTAFRSIVGALSIPVQVCDADGTILYYGGSSQDVFGYTADEVVGRNLLEFTPPEHAHRALESLGDLAMSEVLGIGVPTVYPIICADGSITWQAIGAVPMLDDPDVEGIVLYYLPWDAQLEFDNAVAALLEGDDLPVVLELLTRAIAVHFEAVAASVHHCFDGERFEGATTTGLPEACAAHHPQAPWQVAATNGEPVYAVMDDLRDFLDPVVLADLDRSGIQGVWSIPITMEEDADRAVLTVWRTAPTEPVTAHDFVKSRSLNYARLVLTRWAERQALEYLATSDTLTGLANRARFTSAVEEALDGGEPMVVLFCDVDRFKDVNDELGHQVGDRVLAEVASRLRSELGPGDLLARIGGDEFTAMHVGDEGSAVGMAKRMVEAVASPIDVDGRLIHLGLSVGIASSRTGSKFSDLLNRADVALYQAKGSGGGGVVVAAPDPR